MSDISAPALFPAAAPVHVRGYWASVWNRLRYDYVTLFCLAVIILIVLSAVFAPMLAPMDPDRSSMANRLRAIGDRGYILGTDEQGRDMLSRLLYGGRVSLAMGILPVMFATVIGGMFGVIAGFFGGKVNMLIMRTMDVFFAFPSVLLAVAISGSLGGGFTNQLITLTVVLVPPLCRVAETATSQIRSMDFVDAGRASGASSISIIVHHVLINVMSPVLVYASTLVSVSIILASGLSFLGLGVSPPTADWGLMLSTLRQSIYVQPLVSAIPGIAILITSIAFNLVSDGLRQAMDVKG
ncbi:ABC transporter permease [Mesorhizobium sp. Root552]|jgi:peptide/nickel transport system permease protein|uniref:ABC transporter permease n=1 Tax=Mesorhizobium sp. Root552 TaxID=1736555 RepID=UPI0006FDA575|nr:ABC transporter permease [Mesorhizobium sp. Root552]KQZ20821.1 ABC transporter permease [Mesorhizobium sp. Root552]